MLFSLAWLGEQRGLSCRLFLGFSCDECAFSGEAGGKASIHLFVLWSKRAEDLNMLHMVAASNKPFDYMACGLPLLVTDLPEWVETFVKPGYALACDPDDPKFDLGCLALVS